MDVNHPDTRQLNRYINLPPAWETKAGSGLDWFRIEGFQFGRLDRNLDQIARMVRYPFEELAWPRADVKYLMGHFDFGWLWQRDYLHARPAQVPQINLWAYDHMCLFKRELPMPTEPRRSRSSVERVAESGPLSAPVSVDIAIIPAQPLGEVLAEDLSPPSLRLLTPAAATTVLRI
jgi:hypothetical protein